MTTPYPWQTTQWRRFLQLARKGRLPHALLLHGPEGIGKEDFARLAAISLLCEQPDEDGSACGKCKSCQLVASGNHPDFVSVQAEETGKAIKIDQIRELIRLMTLSPHFGGYRTVLISPAEHMNPAAANSLLKTLEEPQDNTVIFLVTSQLAGLPATIRSRCQRLHFGMPDNTSALAWLEDSIENRSQAGQLLSTANGAPLLARQMAENDTIRWRQQLLQDLTAVAGGQKQALVVAGEWVKRAEGKPLQWLYYWVCDMIRIKCSDKGFVVNQDITDQLHGFAQAIDVIRLYQFLDLLRDTIRFRQTSANELLLLEGVLLSWTYLKTGK